MITLNISPIDLPPGLYVVATPIGNLGDITVRALQTLQSVDRILAEDTRVSGTLLRHYGIRVPLSACHDHNMAAQSQQLVADIAAGARLALISDAGTPLISDPGYVLVRAALAAGVSVVPIPGASAVITALCLAGLPADAFSFAGFLPSTTTARRKRLSALAHLPGTLVLYESPNRLVDLLRDAADILGPRPAAVARELTKHFEDCQRGPLPDLAAHYAAHPPKGEIVVLISAGTAETWDAARVDDALRDHLQHMSVSEAAAAVAMLSGLPRRDIYKRAIEIKA